MGLIFPRYLFLIFFLNSIVISQSPLDPTTWKIDVKYFFNRDGKPNNMHIKDLVSGLEKIEGVGVRVTRQEVISWINQAGKYQIYADKLIKYATPESKKIQKKEHQDYSDIFMKEKRQRAGVDFLKKHAAILMKAENIYGVARKDIVSILMWESGLGEFTGDYRIFIIYIGQLLFLEFAQEYAVEELRRRGETNPLLNQNFKLSEQKRFDQIKNRAVKSLIALLRLCKEKGLNPLEQKGSWGGAIGYPQFMPYRMNYTVDGDGNGKIDLFSWPDAIFSVANYLKYFGNYSTSHEGRERGIYSYNHSNSYVKGVIKYANAIWLRYIKSG